MRRAGIVGVKAKESATTRNQRNGLIFQSSFRPFLAARSLPLDRSLSSDILLKLKLKKKSFCNDNNDKNRNSSVKEEWKPSLSIHAHRHVEPYSCSFPIT